MKYPNLMPMAMKRGNETQVKMREMRENEVRT